MPAESHGRSLDPIYNVWCRMIARCTGAYCTSYPMYGGRGIKVCDRWLESFTAFLADMGERPTANHELDRIDNDGDYTPENCRWATKKQNARNRRSNRRLSLNGRTQTMVEWAEEYGLKPGTLRSRLWRGSSLETALLK